MHEGDVAYRRVSIRPIELLRRAMNLMGDQYWLFLGIVLVGVLIGSVVPFGILMGPMMCGICLCYLQRLRGQAASFETLFRGFDHFTESLIVTIIAMVAQLIILVPAYIVMAIGIIGAIAGGGGIASLFAGLGAVFAYLLILILAAIIPALFMFAFPLIVDRRLTAMPAIKTSFRAAQANLGGIIIMWLVYSLIWLLASCACVIPALLFAPLASGAFLLLYEDIFGVPQKPILAD